MAMATRLVVIMALFPLLQAFLMGPAIVLAANGNGPLMCGHVCCDMAKEVVVSCIEKKEGHHQLVRSTLSRPLRILAVPMSARRRLLAPTLDRPTWDGKHPIPLTPGARPNFGGKPRRPGN